MPAPTTEEKRQEVKRLFVDESYKIRDIITKLQISRNCITDILKTFGINYRTSFGYQEIFSDEQKRNIADSYKNGKTGYELAKEYKVPVRFIYKVLHKFDIIKKRDDWSRKYRLREDFFEKIDTEEKAYILGFIYADGNVWKNSLSINLQEGDRDVLDKINEMIFIDPKKLEYRPSVPLSKTSLVGQKSDSQPQYRFSLRNKKIVEDLSKLGVLERKTSILKFPTEQQVPNHLMRHFIRGHFDGDGGISTYYRKNKFKPHKLKLGISVTSAKEFIEDLMEWLNINENIKLCFHQKPAEVQSNNAGLYQTSNVAEKFLTFIYSNSKIFLNRKMDKFNWYLRNKN